MLNSCRRRLGSLLLLGGLVLLSQALCRPAAAWWNSDWSYRVRVDADTGTKGAALTQPIGHVQVLLRLHSGNFNFATAKDDGSDLRVVAADDRTPLHFQIEKYDGLVDQVGLIWVDVPDLKPSAVTSFYVYWGSKNATNGSDGKATFAADDLLVYHFADQGGPARDTTAFANNALTAFKSVDGGMVGAGAHLDGKSVIRLPQAPSLAVAAPQPLTWSMWVHPDDGVTGGVLYDQQASGSEMIIGIDNKVPYVAYTQPSGTQRSPAAAALAPGWHLIAATQTDRLTLYVDGRKYAELPAKPGLAGSAALGGLVAAPPVAAPAADASQTPATAPPAPPPPAAAPPPGFVGTIDEFRIVKAAVPQGAMLAEVAAEGPTPKLLTLQTPEQSSVFGTGYIGIILKSVTPDAWVVIGILGIMMLISWAVMIAKAIYVGGLNRANGTFVAAYRQQVHGAHGDLLGVMRSMRETNRPAWRGSSLFRLNGVATDEIDDRLHGGRMDARGMLSGASIAAIRSALDARMVKEIQGLNRLMVLLTIAIAGGPFIGLLGTVIGVMITFAAIAQAGDVNVNAIAPGISAALLATVAGLFVAIPALFGYNYFNSRITDAISDMQVHIDLLVTRMGEGLLGSRAQAAE